MDDFKCIRCGNCCRWEGLVRVSESEIERIAHYLDLSIEKFVEQYTTLSYDRTGLCFIDAPKTGHCIFFKENPPSCKIQKVKPVQCSNFPTKWNFIGWESACGAKKEEKN